MTTQSVANDFAFWTQGRAISSIGTNDRAIPLAFQTWHHFKEAFPPELIRQAVEAQTGAVRHVIDPFGGSGTTALACQMLGIDSTTVEINPFLADVIRAKLSRYDVDQLARALAAIRRSVRVDRGDHTDRYFAQTPPTFIEPGVRGRWIFDREVACQIARHLSAIDQIEDDKSRNLFRVVVGGVLASLSNVIVSGKGRRYRRNWADSRVAPERVGEMFSRRAEKALLDIHRHAHRPRTESVVVHGDARLVHPEAECQLSVFSPPYPNSFDYTDVYNLELWILGYLKTFEQNRLLRNSTLSSHVQIKREYAPPPSGSLILDNVLCRLESQRAQLWNPWIPNMVGAYFADLIATLRKIRAVTAFGGESWIVIGDSRYADVLVPVADILSELATASGWSVRSSTPFRHMKSSAQQGWRNELAESLLILSASK